MYLLKKYCKNISVYYQESVHISGYTDSNTWKESADSSGSEASKQDDESSGEFRNPNNNVHFIVGGET